MSTVNYAFAVNISHHFLKKGHKTVMSSAHTSQMVTQTVVSVLTEKNLHPSLNSMTPSVMIDRENFQATLYDPVTDTMEVQQLIQYAWCHSPVGTASPQVN